MGRYGVQEGHYVGTDKGIQRADPGAGYPERDQGGLFIDRFCALWSVCLPHLEARVEDGERNWREKTGGSSLLEVQRDGGMLLPAAAAIGVRHFQELRGPLARCFHGRQWCRDVGQGREL